MSDADLESRPPGVIAGIVDTFLTGRLSIILLMLAGGLGVWAVWATPREEEPQIVVPLADVIVRYPGRSAAEVEKHVATALERLLWQIDGVEYVYSSSYRDMAVVTVRFYVGQDREDSLTRLCNQVQSHIDQAPAGVTWVVKPREIDDVPIVTLTLSSDRLSDFELHRVGQEVLARLESIPNISRSRIAGGRPREVSVAFDPEAARARGITALEVERALRAADAGVAAGAFDRDNRHVAVTAGLILKTSADVGALVVGVYEDRPVYLRDVATVTDGPAERTAYGRIGFGPAAEGAPEDAREGGRTYPAVTLAIAKKRGTNAVQVARDILGRMEELKATVLPEGVDVRVTRNYGRTADEKVNELLKSLGFALITVVGLLLFTMGWREGLVVAVAVPVTFALALFVNYVSGYTINRVTLFALILSLGLVVDDPITNVDNIQRHILMRRRGARLATLWAVKEVLPPVIMSTLAIIVSFTPMFFITGMMGPYMRPMAINVPLAVTFSTVCALTIVPWLAHLLLKRRGSAVDGKEPAEASASGGAEGWRHRAYRAVVGPLLRSRAASAALLAGVGVLMILSVLLVLLRQVPVKMLPFDNKNELQVVIDMPEGVALEATQAVVDRFAAYLQTVPEVTDFQTYAGTASPMDFNGLVRKYYFRDGPHAADIRVNLVHKSRRVQQSHAIVLRIRDDLEALARDLSPKDDGGRVIDEQAVRIKIVEVPPGPPVLSTVVAEVYGDPDRTYEDLIAAAEAVRQRLIAEPGVRDVDVSTEAERRRVHYFPDEEKAKQHGLSREPLETLRLALSGSTPAFLDRVDERQPLGVRVRLPRAQRSGVPELGRLFVKGRDGSLVQLDEIGECRDVPEDQPIRHKNLERVVYVTGEMAGRAPGEAVIDLMARFREKPLPAGTRVEWGRFWNSLPGEGEWKITLRVFRDLGLAFGAALVGIYILVVIETKSFLMPVVIMSAIPLTLIGIMPGFWLLNVIVDDTVGGYPNPVFFTATAMIGMIALGGIVVRNSIVLIEFIRDAVAEGQALREAILASGAVRLRPIVLTAATTALGAWPITLDPVFSGLAWALIFGLTASTLFTLVVVPVIYNLLYGRRMAAASSA